LYQLFSPYGNKSLQPERSQSTEAGVQAFSKSRNAWVRAVYFDRHTRNAIFFESLNIDPYGRYINFDRQHDYGWEFEGQAQVRRLLLMGNLTLLNGAITTKSAAGSDTTYNNLFRRPKTQLNVSAGYQFTPNLLISATVRSVGDRTDRYFNNETFGVDNVTLRAYTTVDLYAEGKLGARVRLYGDVRNLFNESYTDIYGYNTRRRNANVGIRYTW
jgi:vitamin B12 transporter